MALTLHGTVADNTAVLSRRNANPLIINGDMQVAQRGTSFTGQTSSLYSVDRFRWVNASQGTWTIVQSTDVPAGYGFANSMKADCTTADASPASGDFIQFYQKIEGQNLQLLKKGTSSAEAVTVAFWIKSNKTGTVISEIYDYDNTRQISKAFTISSADTWEKKVLSFPGDTTGALGNDNAASLSFGIWMGAGSDFTSGTLSTTWTASTNANRAVGTTNFADNTANEVLVTGFQVEVGDFDANSIAPFQHESYGDSLQRCQRYFQTIECARANAGSLGHVESSQVQTQLALAVKPRILAQYQGSGTLTKVGDIAINTFPSNADSITGVVNWMVLGNTLIFGMTTSDTIVNGSSEPIRYGSSNGQRIFTLDTEL